MDKRGQAALLARRLEGWGTERAWSGTDPYEGLNATRRWVAPLRRSALGRRLLIQAVKRAPLDLRPILGIRPSASGASVAWVVSAYARDGFLGGGEARPKLIDALELLEGLRSTAFPEPCWGYHFDFQSRVVHYRRGEPNTIATAFAGHALLDAHDRLGDPSLLDGAGRVAEFFIRRVGQTESGEGAYFGYHPGDRSPIHNSNLLAGALLARLVAVSDRAAEFAEPARAALQYTVSRQREDGSWPYGERRDLDWVDNFHTGYVLDCLRACAGALEDEAAMSAWRRGLDMYAVALFLTDGTPKYTTESVFPLDGQCAAQAIQTFAVAARDDPRWLELAHRTFELAVRRLRRGDGAFAFQRRRLWTNRTPHPRWVQAPMLNALANLLEASAG
jgi:hypothetical protein